MKSNIKLIDNELSRLHSILNSNTTDSNKRWARNCISEIHNDLFNQEYEDEEEYRGGSETVPSLPETPDLT